MPTKILLTHTGGLRAKYGRAGVRRIREAAKEAVAADKARGVRTRWVALDDGRTARALRVREVEEPDDHKATKAFVDALYAAWQPDYVVLIGSVDVVPMQPLHNPIYSRDPRRGDPDETIPSDLPYACGERFSLDPGRFRGPTRVVGRLPDQTGGTDPATLERLLAIAAGYQPSDRGDYLPPFALTATEWRGSTTQTLERLVGSANALAEVPPASPPWAAASTRRLLHLVNCHGGAADWRYYGQRGRSYPLALDASELAAGTALRKRTVAAAECCYGGMLYDPAEAGGHAGFVDTYLAAGAYGYVAATNVAYGPANGNDGADLVCRFFLQHVLAGCSLGRALLQARQDYVFQKATLSPIDLKTLAQFTLYGDPSVHPLRKPRAAGAATPVNGASALPKSRRATNGSGPPEGVAARRRRLRANGRALAATTTRASAKPVELAAPERRQVEAELAARAGVETAGAELRTFEVVSAPAASAGPDERFHVLFERDHAGLRTVVAREEAGRLYNASVLRER